MTFTDRTLKSVAKPPKLPQFAKNRIILTKLKLRLYRLAGGQIVNFLHIPKAGGSAVKNALRDHTELKRYKIHLRGHSCRLNDIPVGDKFFFFLRSPEKRFVSAFNGKQVDPNRWRHTKYAEETAALERFTTANQLAESLSSTDAEVRQAAEQAMLCIEHVNTFYTDWFISKDYFLSRLPDALYIGFQESLAEDFKNIKQILGLAASVSLPALNSPKSNARANKSLQPPDTTLTEQAMANLAQWYANDYDFIALCREQAVKVNQQAMASTKL
ncbi:MAG: sulfotransferase family 2 domain-containing protein [Phormidesmis sp.]